MGAGRAPIAQLFQLMVQGTSSEQEDSCSDSRAGWDQCPESGEGCIILSFFYYVLVLVVPAERGIALAPHDTNRTTLENVKVHGIQSSLG